MKKYYSGSFKPTNPSKYIGDHSKITFRSHWERQLMRWCDSKPCVKKWSSETVVVPYISPVDLRAHRYFVDFTIEFSNGKKFLVEVKPEAQTRPPKKKKQTKKFMEEVATYGVNQAKWVAAKKFAEANGAEFSVWTEKTLTEGLGIPLNIPKKKYARKYKPK